MATNVAALASAVEALRRCETSPVNEFGMKLHSETIARIMGAAPSGAGIDSGTKLVAEKCRHNRLVFAVAFHRMNEHGFYIGWVNYTVTIEPAFDSVYVSVRGRDCDGLKDYLGELYYHWAVEPCPE